MFNNSYEGKKVLVLGHTGFKGAWLALWLQKLGAEVVGISDGVPTKPNHFESAGLDNEITSYDLDICSKDSLVETIIAEKPDYVFHMAAQALVKASYDDPVRTFNVNAMGTVNVLEALRKLQHSCTAVLITSDKCYDNIETYYGYREDDTLGGADPYSASKAAAEIVISSYVRSFFAEPGSVSIGITRAGNVVGGGDWAADRLVPDIVRSWSEGKNVTIRRPQATRPWQHVLEPLSGYLRLGSVLSQNRDIHGQAYNFGPPAEAVSPVRSVVRALQKHLPGLDLTVDESQAKFHEAGLLKLCCDKALSHLDWKPVLSFDETMAFTAEWYNYFYLSKAQDIKEYSLKQLERYSNLALERQTSWAIA